jgi:flagellar basal-body rod protein FlgB
MRDSLFNDNAMNVSKIALNGLSTRQQLISRNLSNVDTPGYRAQQLDFESVLRKAAQPETTLRMASSHSAHLASPSKVSASSFSVSYRPGGSFRADGNNVDIDTELLEMSQTGIQYQAVSQSITKKLALLKNIAMSG